MWLPLPRQACEDQCNNAQIKRLFDPEWLWAQLLNQIAPEWVQPVRQHKVERIERPDARRLQIVGGEGAVAEIGEERRGSEQGSCEHGRRNRQAAGERKRWLAHERQQHQDGI